MLTVDPRATLLQSTLFVVLAVVFLVILPATSLNSLVSTLKLVAPWKKGISDKVWWYKVGG